MVIYRQSLDLNSLREGEAAPAPVWVLGSERLGPLFLALPFSPIAPTFVCPDQVLSELSDTCPATTTIPVSVRDRGPTVDISRSSPPTSQQLSWLPAHQGQTTLDAS
jgi:hypothetical protein